MANYSTNKFSPTTLRL